MKRVGLCPVLPVTLAVLGRAAQAAVSYTYVTAATDYAATPGQALSIPLYLLETRSGGSASIIANDGGLFGAGFAVTRSTTNLPASPATLTSVSGSSNFAGGFQPDANSTATRKAGAEIVSGNAAGGPLPDAGGLVQIGTVAITAGTVSGQTTAFDLGAYAPGVGGYTQTFAFPGSDLDVSSATSSTGSGNTGAGGTAATPKAYDTEFTVTVVPEPASLAGLAVVGLALGRCGRTRSRPATGK